MKGARFSAGSEGQTFAQAWAAMRKGYFVRRATWPEGICYTLDEDELGVPEFIMADLTQLPSMTASRDTDNIKAEDIVATDWQVTLYSTQRP